MKRCPMLVLDLYLKITLTAHLKRHDYVMRETFVEMRLF